MRPDQCFQLFINTDQVWGLFLGVVHTEIWHVTTVMCSIAPEILTRLVRTLSGLYHSWISFVQSCLLVLSFSDVFPNKLLVLPKSSQHLSLENPTCDSRPASYSLHSCLYVARSSFPIIIPSLSELWCPGRLTRENFCSVLFCFFKFTAAGKTFLQDIL